MNPEEVISVLGALTRTQLRSIAKQGKIRVGKSRTETVKNLSESVLKGRITVSGTIYFKVLENVPGGEGLVPETREKVVGIARFNSTEKKELDEVRAVG